MTAPARSYLQSLTPLRGIAALWVAVYHYTFQYFPNLHPDAYTKLVEKGYLAVDLFFLLSGFVIMHVYHDALGKTNGDAYWKFFSARIARLYPLHFVVLCLFLATALAARAMEYAATGKFELIPLDGARSISALFANLFMLQGLHASELSWNYPAWSISVEFMAYLVFPLALPAIWRAPILIRIFMALALFAALGALTWMTKDNFNQWDGPLTLLRCLPEFLLGAFLYTAFRNRVGIGILSADVVVVGLALVLMTLLHLGAPDLGIVAAFATLVVALAYNQSGVAAALDKRWLVWLGEISYSLYLIHGLVQYVTTAILEHGFGLADRTALSAPVSLALTLAMLTVTLLAATLSYRRIEVPGRRYLREALASAHGPRQEDPPPALRQRVR